MLDLFDSLGRSLNNLIEVHENNNVAHAATQMFASGGVVDPSYTTDIVKDNEGPSVSSKIISSIDRAANNVASPDLNIFGGKETNYYNSPEGITQRVTSGWGRFFQGPQPNTGGTNSPMEKPGKSKPAESTNPTDFYARWYNRMREFSQAEEVANRGQAQVRTR